MKGKILLSVLFCLILVFGMLFAACDNGAAKEDPYKNDNTKTAVDWNPAIRWFLSGGGVYLKVSSPPSLYFGKTLVELEKLLEEEKDEEKKAAIKDALKDVTPAEELVNLYFLSPGELPLEELLPFLPPSLRP